MKHKYPLISIIISNYNGSKLNILQDCLNSFKKIDYPNYELILMDNASTDNSLRIAEKMLGNNPKFRVIQNPINMYSQGLNLGLQASKGEYVAYFNNDVAIGKRYFHQLIKAFEKYPKLALAQGKLLWYYDHSIIDSAGESMDIYGNPVTIGYQTKDNRQFDKEEEVLSASGSACLLRKEMLVRVGNYGSYFGIGYEDMDLGLRLRQAGFSVMRIPSAVCFHKRGATDLSAIVKVKARMHFNKNRLATMIRNYPSLLLWQTLPVTMSIYLGSFLWEIFAFGNINLAMTRLKAILWVIVHLPRLIDERWTIRENVSDQRDRQILGLFAKVDLLGKTRAVILDRLSALKKIQYLLPWTYPAEIKNLIPKNSTVLDIGCGNGHLGVWINYLGEYTITGVDINRVDLETAKQKVTYDKKPIYKELILMDLTRKIPFKQKFDVILCSQVVEHLEKAKAWKLINRMEALAKRRVIIATTNGFFQFNHRVAQKHDVHISGWSVKEFSEKGYRVHGSGLRIIYKPGALKDRTPAFLHPILFIISYLSTPIIRVIHPAALFLIAYKNIS